LLPWFRERTNIMIEQAQANDDPRTAAEEFLESFPESADAGVFAQFLESPQWWEAFQQFDARVGSYGQWFAAMHAQLMGLVAEMKREAIEEAAAAQPPPAPVASAPRPARVKTDAVSDRPGAPPPLS
jgi:hypothetical protein